MNKSEQLLSAFSEEFFFKDLLIDDLHFTPNNQSEIELADLIINLGDIIVVIQLKGRDDNQSLKNTDDELKWLESRAKKAKSKLNPQRHGYVLENFQRLKTNPD